MKCLQLAELDNNCVNVCIPVNKSSIMKPSVTLFTCWSSEPFIIDAQPFLYQMWQFCKYEKENKVGLDEFENKLRMSPKCNCHIPTASCSTSKMQLQ